MNKRVRIGAGSKTIDRVLWLIQLIILFAFITLAVVIPETWLFCVIIFISMFAGFIRKRDYTYLSIEGDEFIIEKCFGNDIRINADNYVTVKSAGFGFSFMNAQKIYFKHGPGYKFMGGTSSVHEIKATIAQYIFK